MTTFHLMIALAFVLAALAGALATRRYRNRNRRVSIDDDNAEQHLMAVLAALADAQHAAAKLKDTTNTAAVDCLRAVDAVQSALYDWQGQHCRHLDARLSETLATRRGVGGEGALSALADWLDTLARELPTIAPGDCRIVIGPSDYASAIINGDRSSFDHAPDEDAAFWDWMHDNIGSSHVVDLTDHDETVYNLPTEQAARSWYGLNGLDYEPGCGSHGTVGYVLMGSTLLAAAKAASERRPND